MDYETPQFYGPLPIVVWPVRHTGDEDVTYTATCSAFPGETVDSPLATAGRAAQYFFDVKLAHLCPVGQGYEIDHVELPLTVNQFYHHVQKQHPLADSF